MKALIVGTSVHHVNTESIAKVMVDVLNGHLLQSKQVTMSILERYDISN